MEEEDEMEDILIEGETIAEEEVVFNPQHNQEEEVVS